MSGFRYYTRMGDRSAVSTPLWVYLLVILPLQAARWLLLAVANLLAMIARLVILAATLAAGWWRQHRQA